VNGQSVPLVSVVTPVYNGGRYLRECIESVITQTYPNWRYTIVNNCSTDDTLAIAREYERRDSRIRVHDNTDFLPIIDNHNRAVSLIDAESVYCKPLMADDWLYPECVEVMAACALSQPSIGLVCCCGRAGDGSILFDRLPRSQSSTTLLAGNTAGRMSFLEDRHFFGSPTTTLIRADLIRKRDRLYDPVNVHADPEMCYDILRESDFGFVHTALVYIRDHEESQTSNLRGLESIRAGRFYTLVKYGRAYLSGEEFERRYSEKQRDYYAMLAVGAVELRGRKFWEFHRRMLDAAGAPLDQGRLVRAVASHVVRKLISPASLMRSIANRVSALFKK
jgi:glycosyltransferase involved in cell wall biosynthesis